jgi:hypothetical protein
MIQKSTNGKRHSRRTVEKPQDWDKVLSAAFFRLQGMSQEAVANAVGCVRQTIVVWEASDFWVTALTEATDRWLDGLRGKAMAGVEAGVLKDGRLALDVLGRVMPELAPNAIKLEHSGGVSIDMHYIEEAREQLRNRIARFASTGG